MESATEARPLQFIFVTGSILEGFEANIKQPPAKQVDFYVILNHLSKYMRIFVVVLAYRSKWKL